MTKPTPEIAKWITLARQSAERIDRHLSHEYGTWTMLEVLRFQAWTGDINGARETADVLRASANDAQMADGYDEIARAQAKLGDIAGARKTADGCGEDGDFIYTNIAQEQASHGDVAGAIDTAAALSDRKTARHKALIESAPHRVSKAPDPEIGKAVAYGEIAAACGKAGDAASAKAMIERALSIIDTISEPDEKDQFLSIISADQAMSGDVKGAARTADRIADKGKRMDAHISIAKRQIENGGDLVQARHDLDRYSWKCHWNAWPRALNAIAEAQLRANDWAGATCTAQRLCKIAEQALEDAAKIFAQACEISAARQIAESIQDEKCRHDISLEIGKVQAAAGDFDAALQTAGAIKYNRHEILEAVVEAQAAGGDFAGACQTADSIDESNSYPESKVGAYYLIVKALVKAGRIAEAEKVTREMPPCSGRAGAFFNIAGGRVRAGGADQIADWASALPTPEDVTNAFLGAAWTALAPDKEW